MVLIDQKFELVDVVDGPGFLKKIERAGRTCYKSEEKITEDSAERFVHSIVKLGHLSVIEHVNITIKFITNRGVTHELVRHRLASYSQESTRYCDYGLDDMQFIKPVWWEDSTLYQRNAFTMFLKESEAAYKKLLRNGWKPQQAREVLPNALKTEIVVTANIREWMHILNLRCSPAAHPQIRMLMLELLNCLSTRIPVVFDSLKEKYLMGVNTNGLDCKG